MSSTFLDLHYHFVFSTKYRRRHIADCWRESLFKYLGGTVTGLAGSPLGIGGTDDHVHLLVGLKATHCVADFMRELKRSSSRWVHDTTGHKSFAWQEGYGAFTVSATMIPQVRSYIANQAEHHRKMTFREELEAFLKRANIQYEDRWID